MSQRTRSHTTDATAKPTSRAAQPAPEASAQAATPATRRAKRATVDTPAEAPSEPPSAPSAPSAPSELPMRPDALARALRAVATELERDPALAKRVAQAINDVAPPAQSEPGVAEVETPEVLPESPTVGRKFRPTIVTGVAEDLGPGVPDPFALRAKLGEAKLKEALASLRMGSLRAIIRQHGLDRDGSLIAINDAAKLRAHILAATRKGAK